MSKLKEKGNEDKKREFRVRIRFESEWLMIGSTVIDALGHLVQILGGCNIRHFMVQLIARMTDFVEISNDQSIEAVKSKCSGLLQKWKEEYRVDSFFEAKDKSGNDRWRITFCN